MNLLKKLMPRDSFYLILFVCISVLGASAVWVSKEKVNVSEKPKVKQEVVEEEIKLDLNEKEITRKDISKEKPKPEVEPQKEVVKKQEKPVEKKQVETKPNPEPKTQEQEQVQTEAVASGSVEVNNEKLKKPVIGNISKDFSKDKLVYSKTLDEWSTHLGIDIAAKEGTDVVAALDGIVKQVKKDEKLGITIILDHGNGLETVYQNIATEKMVKTSQKVKTGEVISKVSKGIGFEKLEDPHLHFEVLKSGNKVDPKSFF